MKGWHLGDHLLQMVGKGRFPWGVLGSSSTIAASSAGDPDGVG